MTDYTPNYHLPLYEDADKPNLRDQYNGAMGLIDSQFKAGETDLTTVQNLIAGINRDITTINESIESANSQISALQTLTTNQGATLTEQGEDITKAQSDITANAQGLATQGGYWSALGVSNLDEALDLHSDINDAHTHSMSNQADIAELKIKDAAHDSSISTINGQISTLQTTVAANTQGLTIANQDIELLQQKTLNMKPQLVFTDSKKIEGYSNDFICNVFHIAAINVFFVSIGWSEPLAHIANSVKTVSFNLSQHVNPPTRNIANGYVFQNAGNYAGTNLAYITPQGTLTLEISSIYAVTEVATAINLSWCYLEPTTE